MVVYHFHYMFPLFILMFIIYAYWKISFDYFYKNPFGISHEHRNLLLEYYQQNIPQQLIGMNINDAIDKCLLNYKGSDCIIQYSNIEKDRFYNGYRVRDMYLPMIILYTDGNIITNVNIKLYYPSK